MYVHVLPLYRVCSICSSCLCAVGVEQPGVLQTDTHVPEQW